MISLRKWWDRAVLRRLRDNRRGNVAIIAAVTMTPMLIGIAGALDLSSRVSTQDIAQSALDSAVLYAAGTSTNDPAKLLSITQAAFAANVANTTASDASVDAGSYAYDAAGRIITVTATGPYHDALSGIVALGTPTYTVKNSVARRSFTNVEIALVLDNTYSMSQPAPGDTVSKISSLQSSATVLADTLLQHLAGVVKIGVVPYAERVNVGTSPPNAASWLNIPASQSQCVLTGVSNLPTNRAACLAVTRVVTTCPSVAGTCTATNDGVTRTYPCMVRPRTCPSPTTSITRASWTTSSFLGCIIALADGSGNLLMPDPSIQYQGILGTFVNCPKQMLPLTDQKSLLDSELQGMYTSIEPYYGNTYIPIGLVWGVNLLSPSEPYTQGLAYDPSNSNPHKVLILMTDGANDFVLDSSGTLTSPSGSNPVSKTYSDQQKVCDYAKGKKIEVFTVGFGLDPTVLADQQSLAALQSCATDASHYYDAKNSQQLLSAFNQIATHLSQSRIAS